MCLAYGWAVRNSVRANIVWRLPIVLGLLVSSACHATTPQNRQTNGETLPTWVNTLIQQQPPQSRLVVEESVYEGRRTFLVMPPDRAFDSGNEHVLHSEDGRVICEFGGLVGQVTAGSCDIDKIKYVRTVFGRSGS